MRETTNFTEVQWNCRCEYCRREVPHEMKAHVMEKVQLIREAANRPLILDSAYRCRRHPEEARKASPGRHNQGLAVDIRVNSDRERVEIIELGLKHGARGFGVANSFVHLDWREDPKTMWLYN